MRRRLELGLWALAITTSVWASLRIRQTAPELDAPPAGGALVPRQPGMFGADALAAAADVVIRGDPFRLERRPSEYTPGSEIRSDAPNVTRPARPSLRLSGVIGGASWAAILEGVPGHTRSLVVRRGEVVGGLRVRMVVGDTVIVEGVDTTWILTLDQRRP